MADLSPNKEAYFSRRVDITRRYYPILPDISSCYLAVTTISSPSPGPESKEDWLHRDYLPHLARAFLLTFEPVVEYKTSYVACFGSLALVV